MTNLANFLWFDDGAEEAARFYASLFDDGAVTEVTRVKGADGAARALTVGFKLDGVSYIALNGGPSHKLTSAFSISAPCAEQTEIDRLWNALVEDGAPMRCGWLTDRFG